MSQHSISSAEDGIKWDGSSGRVLLLLLEAKQANFLSAICSGECGRLNDGDEGETINLDESENGKEGSLLCNHD